MQYEGLFKDSRYYVRKSREGHALSLPTPMPRHKQMNGYFNLHVIISKKWFFWTIFSIFKFIFNKLEQFQSSSSTSSEKLFFRVRSRDSDAMFPFPF